MNDVKEKPPTHPPVNPPQGLMSRLVAINRQVKAIDRQESSTPQARGRKIDEIMNMLHPLLAAEGVVRSMQVLEQSTAHENRKYTHAATVRIHFHCDGPGDFYSEIFGAMEDSTAHGASSKLHTLLEKRALCQVFTIPYAEQQNEWDGQQASPLDAKVTLLDIRKVKAAWYKIEKKVKGDAAPTGTEAMDEFVATIEAVPELPSEDVLSPTSWTHEQVAFALEQYK